MVATSAFVGAPGSGVLTADLSGGDLDLSNPALLYQFGQKGATLRLIISASGGKIIGPAIPGRNIEVENNGAADVFVTTNPANPGAQCRATFTTECVCKTDASDYEILSTNDNTPSTGGGSVVIVWQPGVVDPKTSETWADVMTALNALPDGVAFITLKGGGPWVIPVPPSGPPTYNLRGAKFTLTTPFNVSGSGPVVTVSDTVTLLNLAGGIGPMTLDFDQPTSGGFDWLPAASPTITPVLALADGFKIQSSGGVPPLSGTPLNTIPVGASVLVVAINGGSWSNVGGRPSFNVLGALGNIMAEGAGGFTFGSGDIVGTGTFSMSFDASQQSQQPLYPGFAGGTITTNFATGGSVADAAHLPGSANRGAILYQNDIAAFMIFTGLAWVALGNASAYTAFTPGNWGPGTAPATVSQALDRLAQQSGNISLIAGQITVNTGITITADSKVFVQPVVSQGVAQGVKYVVTNKTVGGPPTGAFTIQAQDATGAVVATDTSNLDWIIFAILPA